MDIVKRVVGVVHILAAIMVGLQQMFSSTYEGSGDVWEVLNYVMFTAIVLALVFNFIRKRANDASGDTGLSREYLESNVMFYLTSAMAILFVYNWVGDLVGDEGGGTLTGIVWTVVNVVFVLISAATGAYLLRDEARE